MGQNKSILKGPELRFNEFNSPDTIVVFMHGYGSNGEDLIDLARDFVEVLPNAVFLSPNAPYQFEGMPYPGSYQWCSLREFTEPALDQELDKVMPVVEQYLEGVLARFHLPADRLVLIGFSQGTFVALRAALYTNVKAKAVIGYSGGFIKSSNQPINNKPEICLIHGDMDDVLPIVNLHEADAALNKLNIPIESHICKGLSHGISPKGIELGKQFLSKLFVNEKLNTGGIKK